MVTWEDLDIESRSEKDEVEDVGNVVVGLVATVASDVESGTDSEDENEVYSKLTRSELIESVEELLIHFRTRSKKLKELKERYVSLLILHETTLMDMENIEAENEGEKNHKRGGGGLNCVFENFFLTC